MHQVKGLKGFVSTIIFLNKDSSNFKSLNAIPLVEAKDLTLPIHAQHYQEVQ
jgi:hypothetical protein